MNKTKNNSKQLVSVLIALFLALSTATAVAGEGLTHSTAPTVAPTGTAMV